MTEDFDLRNEAEQPSDGELDRVLRPGCKRERDVLRFRRPARGERQMPELGLRGRLPACHGELHPRQ